jgi:hypothetical protein
LVWLGIPWAERCHKIGNWGVGFFVILMEAYRLLANKKTVSRTLMPESVTTDQRIIVEKLRSGATSEEMKADYPDKSIFLFKHLIYDLTGYTHPGGDIIFVNHNFKEISRYVMGTHPDEHEKFPTWVHSQAAYQMLDKHLIGSMIDGPVKISNNNMLLTFNDSRFEGIDAVIAKRKAKDGPPDSDSSEENLMGSPIKPTAPEPEMDDNWTLYNNNGTKRAVSEVLWHVHQNAKVSKNLHVIQFRNAKFSVKVNLKGVCWLGKHYYLEGIQKKPYTTVNCLSQEAIQYRSALIQHYDMVSNTTDAKNNDNFALVDFPVFSESLCFGIKPYRGAKALSHQLCSAKQGNKFKVEGPFGTGLDISRTFNGKCVLIGFGTGILPYLDLFDFLLKKAIYLKFQAQGLTDKLEDIKPV